MKIEEPSLRNHMLRSQEEKQLLLLEVSMLGVAGDQEIQGVE